jgi:hypothetical protein
MERSMELVRGILAALEQDQSGFASKVEIEGYSEEQIGFHCLLLGEAGLIECENNTTLASNSPSARPIRLTWAGYEFIDNAKNDEIWGQAKQVVSKVGEVSFSVWASVISQVVLKNLNL